jgi:hypothetical protein
MQNDYSVLSIFVDAAPFVAAFTSAVVHCRSEMLINAMRIVARETGFTVIDHALGFTAIREDDGGRLLFCLSTGEWSILDGQTAKTIASVGLDQLCSNADPPSGLSYRAFEHIAHAQFAPDPLHIDSLTLVGKA